MAAYHVLHDQLEQTSNPVAPLALIVLPSAEPLGEKINKWISYFRLGDHNEHRDDPTYEGYYEQDYRLPVSLPRFPTGESVAILESSARGKDIYILVDVTNHSITYEMNGFTNHMSPDDHFQDLKRVIAAINGKAHRINVIMPFLYEGRQHNRSGRESLDAAIMYKELCDLGMTTFITFDAHDPRIQNASPLIDFNNFTTPYQFLKSLMRSVDNLIVDKDHVVVISPDEGALDRAVYFASVIGADTGMFYKRRDYSVIVGGKNPIVAHEFLGTDRVFLCTTFGLFTDGLDVFDEAYAKGYFDKLVTTNLTYQPPELEDREWFECADMSKYAAMIIDFINHDISTSQMKTSTERIHGIIAKINRHEQTLMEQLALEQTEF